MKLSLKNNSEEYIYLGEPDYQNQGFFKDLDNAKNKSNAKDDQDLYEPIIPHHKIPNLPPSQPSSPGEKLYVNQGIEYTGNAEDKLNAKNKKGLSLVTCALLIVGFDSLILIIWLLVIYHYNLL